MELEGHPKELLVEIHTNLSDLKHLLKHFFIDDLKETLSHKDAHRHCCLLLVQHYLVITGNEPEQVCRYFE